MRVRHAKVWASVGRWFKTDLTLRFEARERMLATADGFCRLARLRCWLACWQAVVFEVPAWVDTSNSDGGDDAGGPMSAGDTEASDDEASPCIVDAHSVYVRRVLDELLQSHPVMYRAAGGNGGGGGGRRRL